MNLKTENTPLLLQVQQAIAVSEKLKYPAKHYQYSTFTTNVNGQPRKVVHVKYDGSLLDDDDIKVIVTHAIAVRKLSILAGVLNALEFSSSYLTDNLNERRLIQDKLEKLYQNILTNRDAFDDEVESVDRFIENLVHDIETVTKKQSAQIIRQVRNAERYFVASYRSDILVNETVIDGETIKQIDVSLNNVLTASQRREFHAIHDQTINKPIWFLCLEAWEQKWFLDHIPVNLNDKVGWSKFENLNQSSAMSHVPGIQNARHNFLFADSELLSQSIKTSTMLNYVMPQGKQKLPQTVEQVLNQLKVDAKQKFAAKWINQAGESLLANVKPLVFVQALLSDVAILGAGDNELANEQVDAIRSLAQQPSYQDVMCVTGNDPVNILRKFVFSEHYSHNQQIIDYGKNIQTQLQAKKTQLNKDQLKSYKFIKALIKQLTKSRSKILPAPGRNVPVYKVAYTQILVEEVAGAVSTNCKSGKDRTGIEEIYAAAIRLYYRKYKELPQPWDNGVKRKNFIALFIPLFNSMKTQESAAANTPGSFGLKDDLSSMLCDDIKEALDKTYKLSNTLSALNKPKIFKHDEEKEVSDMKKRAKKLSKQQAKLQKGSKLQPNATQSSQVTESNSSHSKIDALEIANNVLIEIITKQKDDTPSVLTTINQQPAVDPISVLSRQITEITAHNLNDRLDELCSIVTEISQQVGISQPSESSSESYFSYADSIKLGQQEATQDAAPAVINSVERSQLLKPQINHHQSIQSPFKISSFWQRNKWKILGIVLTALVGGSIGGALVATGIFAPFGVGIIGYSTMVACGIGVGLTVGAETFGTAMVMNQRNYKVGLLQAAPSNQHAPSVPGRYPSKHVAESVADLKKSGAYIDVNLSQATSLLNRGSATYVPASIPTGLQHKRREPKPLGG